MNSPVSTRSSGQPDISVVCAVSRYARNIRSLHDEWSSAIRNTGMSAEFLYVFHGSGRGGERDLRKITGPGPTIRIFTVAQGFGEAAALQFAFERCHGRFVLTVPDRHQVEPEDVRIVLDELNRGTDVVVTRREPRNDALLNRLQSKAFHALVGVLSRRRFNDMTCGLRGFCAEAARRLDLYGDHHRFIPLLAMRHGYRVAEVPVRQGKGDDSLRLFGPGIYAKRLLDVLNIFFLTRFTQKPLRFYGLIGLILGTAGLAISGALAVLRLLGRTALSDRPLLLLGVVLIVLGVQVVSIGMIGEIIIFLSPRREMPEVSEVGGAASPDAAPDGDGKGE